MNAPALLPRVVRPSCVWNTRRPFLRYIRDYRTQVRRQCVLDLAQARVLKDIKTRREEDHRAGIRGVFCVSRLDKQTRPIWSSYCCQFAEKKLLAEFDPPLDDVAADLLRAVEELRVNSIVQIVALFESFAQCWALNMLLAKLESRGTPGGWTPEEEALAVAFSPVSPGRRGRVPGWRQVLGAFPSVLNALGALPPDDSAEVSAEGVRGAASSGMSLCEAVMGWGDFRALAVHRARRVSKAFLARNAAFVTAHQSIPGWNLDATSYGVMMPLDFEVTRRMRYAFRRAAEVMENMLYDESRGSRGTHVMKACVCAARDPLGADEVLLRTGDHGPSVAWLESWAGKRARKQ